MQRDFLKARFACVRQDLNDVLGRLTNEDLPWRPQDGMKSVAGQLLEIANKEKEAIAWLQTGRWPEDEGDAFDEESADLAEIKVTLHSLRQSTFGYIDSLSDFQLEELVHNPEIWWETLRLQECPRGEVLRNIAVHEWYHTGQLVTYLWILGRNPED